jgi:hypothetical protein
MVDGASREWRAGVPVLHRFERARGVVLEQNPNSKVGFNPMACSLESGYPDLDGRR